MSKTEALRVLATFVSEHAQDAAPTERADLFEAIAELSEGEASNAAAQLSALLRDADKAQGEFQGLIAQIHDGHN